MKVECRICPHHCSLEEGQRGLCRARMNLSGTVTCENYGKLTAVALDPIEKKPLHRFHPGSKILSVGSYGCNLRCLFCQNSEISMAGGEKIHTDQIAPEELVEYALKTRSRGNIGIAYTYNEPLVSYEFVRDCAVLARENGLKNVVVTNGYICSEPLLQLLPFIDAMNIDLKAFTEKFYRKMRGDLETVKTAISLASKECHVEVTTLVIPGENDSEEEMEQLSSWLASVSPEMPYHISRFFPRFEMQDRGPTPVDAIYRLADVARRHLKHVYEGNV
jgi:pyruvate formate lyase activating enzyme